MTENTDCSRSRTIFFFDALVQDALHHVVILLHFYSFLILFAIIDKTKSKGESLIREIPRKKRISAMLMDGLSEPVMLPARIEIR